LDVIKHLRTFGIYIYNRSVGAPELRIVFVSNYLLESLMDTNATVVTSMTSSFRIPPYILDDLCA